LIGYFDASALVKRYVEENHSREVADLLSTTIAVTCRLSESEIASALARRCREGRLSLSARNRLLAAMQRDMASLWVVEISPDVSAAACRLLMRHKLRAGDALQLASALVLAHRSNLEIKFICFDQSLNKAAVQEGIMLPGSGRKM
jgi:predicted nucleic acid-binding protein